MVEAGFVSHWAEAKVPVSLLRLTQPQGFLFFQVGPFGFWLPHFPPWLHFYEKQDDLIMCY